MRRKICVITGTRAEYGLLYWLLKAIKEDIDLELQLVVTGMHLSPEFGLTYKNIEKDGFIIDKKIEILLSSDSATGISKSMGLGMIGFAEALAELQPDLVVMLGDRFEIFSMAAAAMISRIPVAHLHGGEATEGLIDEAIRHSVTKMSHLHFTATEEYKNRVIQLGEQPGRVFNVGAMGIENINKLALLDKEAFEKSITFKLGVRNALVTFHPVTLEKSSAEIQFKTLLEALDSITDLNIIFTKANADTDGRVINEMIDEYVKHHKNSIAFSSLGQLRYLSALQYVDVVIGNSSSGIIEVPSFKKATVNIGDRQKGRSKAASIIDCTPDLLSVRAALEQALSEEFKEVLAGTINPYGTGNASEKILPVLKSADLDNILKKEFYDLKHGDK
ncbi:GDP/UDP-N,N'-diacetylbacillosamine 2-epimerase (hydrolysing) [Chitinophaga sp. YR573]|uniref:UDP-N-acetylglucosamine 2-epimerase n=1 Tax=Chitinophaga sp. YR573 TaxID=1881040 RepID=UPI0008BF34FE|nr:UDP-N-acetylglucosamine 2-epimerase [Chitinophaga sp. YR573]SEW44461.1 GDP/UDP-N,N'-diacetylbacillosamine 2-epimerase (hydrolysing) [Chitinophaga sp. YR573]